MRRALRLSRKCVFKGTQLRPRSSVTWVEQTCMSFLFKGSLQSCSEVLSCLLLTGNLRAMRLLLRIRCSPLKLAPTNMEEGKWKEAEGEESCSG